MASVVATGSTGEVYGPWIYDYKWAGNTLSYAFPDSAADFGYTSSNTLSVLNGAQKTAVRRALEQVESFTGLSFTESANQSGATLRFVHDSAQPTASAYYPYAGEEGGDGFFGNDTRSPVTGNYDDFTFMHEIGHMLGLEHGHEAAGFAGGAYDSTEYTIMTYSAYVGDTKDYFTIGEADYAQSYQQLDIAALQFLYGANYDSSGQVWSGDSVYTFDPDTGEMSINGAGQGTPAGNRIFRTIWDGHGEDTYDLSNYTERTTIDLTPGAWSTFSSSQLSDLDTTSALPSRIAEGNLANALLYQGDTRSLIENAIGGTRQDFITGNQAANRLEGRDGRDVISGEGGKDTIYGGGHTDVLDGDDGSDFVSGGQGADLLRGGRGNDRLNGNGGNDDLRGGAGADQLRGGAGDDRLLGGTGPDRLYGQAGSDTFVFASVNDSHSDNRDRIFDFVAGVDRIDLSDVVDTPDMLIGGGARSATPSVTTVERGGDTLVLVDADGNRSIDMKIVLVGSLGLGEADFLV